MNEKNSTEGRPRSVAPTKNIRATLTAIVFLTMFTTNALAQSGGGINGTVTDENDAKIAGAQVILSSSTGVQLNTATDEAGVFKFEHLKAGSYLIEVKANGFANFTSEEIQLARGESKQVTASESPATDATTTVRW